MTECGARIAVRSRVRRRTIASASNSSERIPVAAAVAKSVRNSPGSPASSRRAISARQDFVGSQSALLFVRVVDFGDRIAWALGVCGRVAGCVGESDGFFEDCGGGAHDACDGTWCELARGDQIVAQVFDRGDADLVEPPVVERGEMFYQDCARFEQRGGMQAVFLAQPLFGDFGEGGDVCGRAVLSASGFDPIFGS